MDIQSVPKVGISSVVHSKHIDADNIDVVDNDIALFDTESVISLYNGPTKLEVLTVGLCLEGTGTFNISLREFQLCPGLMVVGLPNQIIEQRYFSHDFKGIFFAMSKNLLEALPKIGNVLSLFFYQKILEYSLIVSQVKADSWRFESARERYNLLLETHPEIIKRAPLAHIASYLLMTPETLSRVRSGVL